MVSETDIGMRRIIRYKVRFGEFSRLNYFRLIDSFILEIKCPLTFSEENDFKVDSDFDLQTIKSKIFPYPKIYDLPSPC